MTSARGQGRTTAAWPERTFPGRELLLDELTDLARAAAGGSGSVVLLTGEAGIGKTSVARAVAREVTGFTELRWGTCSAGSGAPPFWPWRELLDVDAVAARPEGWFDPALGAERFEALSDLRAQLLRHGEPLLFVLEDLQWADVASVLLLAHVGAVIDRAPLMILATYRTGELLAPQLHAATDEVRRLASVRPVPPLSVEAIRDLLQDLGLESDPALASRIRERTGGNPLYVTELLRASRQTASGDALERIVAGGVPERVAELIAERLDRLPDPVADITRTASVVGTHGDVRALAQIQGAAVEATVDLLEQARAAQLLDSAAPGSWQFRHDLVRDAVYESLGDVTRARRHVAVLEGLAAAGSPLPSVLAHHALAAQPLFDPDRAVALAADAGRFASVRHAYEEAAEWFERALAAAPPDIEPERRAELLVMLGEACRNMGDLIAAAPAFVEAADLTDDPSLLARAALGYASPGADLGIAFRSDDPLTARLLEAAIAAQTDDTGPTRVYLEARLAAELYFSDQPGRARELAEAASARARRLDDLAALGVASAVHHDAFVVGQADLETRLAGSAQLLEWARASGSTGARMVAHRARVMDLLSAGDLLAMDGEIVAFRRIAEPLRAPGYLWWPALWSAMRALLEGRHELAEQLASEAFDLGRGPFPSLALLNLSFLLFFLRREQGRLDELEQATREYAASFADVPALRAGLIFLLSEIGRVDEARGLLASISGDDLTTLRDRNWPASWFQMARAAFLVGDERMARELLDDRNDPSDRCVMVSLGTVCLGSTDLARGWLLHAVGELDAADDRYLRAEEACAQIGARSWLAQARADRAALLIERDRDGDRAEAVRLVQLAGEAADDIGLRLVTDQIAHLRGRLAVVDEAAAQGPRDSGPGATFRRSGDVWEVEFAGRAARLVHTRGMSDLAFLLARPEQAVSVLELSGDHPHLASGTRGAEALDERARREIRDRLRELDAEVDDAERDNDHERAALARERRQELAEAVARDLGLGGRSRRVDDPVERARKTVSTRIRRTIASVGRAHPELGRHLERSIDTGAWCTYRPSEPVAWSL